jgi:hypothetical protein
MRGRRVFFKRDEFRESLQRIGAPNESRVLAVDGDRFTGKTYSRDFLNFLRENEPAWKCRNQQIIYINMDECVFEPEDLARTIGAFFGLKAETMPPDKGEQAARRIPALLEWLTVGLHNSPVHVFWLVLDGFRVKVQPQATHDLIRATIDAVDRDLDKVRMILLNYIQHIDLDVVYILKEKIEPINEDRDLPMFFRHVYTLSRKSFTEADIEETVEDVRKQVNDEVTKRGPEWRMKLLSVALTSAANKLLN